MNRKTGDSSSSPGTIFDLLPVFASVLVVLALERCMKTEIKALEAVIKTMDAAPEKTKPPCADKIVEIDGKKFKLTPL